LRFLKQRPSTIPDESSVVAVQIFDQRKFKRRDQGFLGVVNVRVSDVLDLELGGHGRCFSPLFRYMRRHSHTVSIRNVDFGLEKVERQSRCARQTHHLPIDKCDSTHHKPRPFPSIWSHCRLRQSRSEQLLDFPQRQHCLTGTRREQRLIPGFQFPRHRCRPALCQSSSFFIRRRTPGTAFGPSFPPCQHQCFDGSCSCNTDNCDHNANARSCSDQSRF
jgi:hypothetical protein